MGQEFRPVAPIDPTNLRPLLFLDVANQLMLNPGWPYRAVTVVMESHGGPGRFSFYGANHPGTIDAVHEGRVDVSTVNIGGVQQPPLPLARMVRDSPVTPLDVPLHPRAAAVWKQYGFR
ncbi:MAG: hypothetical protein JO016_16120 [Actinobacteria bacterium]|nr:hypothetical protein [Actinomycetota bacterium]